MDDDFYEIIEKLNLDYLSIKESEEYLLGLKIKNLKKLIKGLHFRQIFEKLKVEFKSRKYNKTLNNEILDINNSAPNNKKIVVYTCITGGYDSVYEPLIKLPNVDYILFSNEPIKTKIWKNVVISQEIVDKYNSNILLNRYYKMNPHEVFKNDHYDYAIYVDGNIEIISDITKLVSKIDLKYGIAFHYHSVRNCIYDEGKVCHIMKKGNKKNIDHQLKKYQDEKFPKAYGMIECNIIVVDLANDKANKIMNQWWNEFVNSNSFRDQLSIPYILWKNNIKIQEVATLGLNVYKNPIVRVERNHK